MTPVTSVGGIHGEEAVAQRHQHTREYPSNISRVPPKDPSIEDVIHTYIEAEKVLYQSV